MSGPARVAHVLHDDDTDTDTDTDADTDADADADAGTDADADADADPGTDADADRDPDPDRKQAAAQPAARTDLAQDRLRRRRRRWWPGRAGVDRRGPRHRWAPPYRAPLVPLATVARTLDGLRAPLLRFAFARSRGLRRAAGSRTYRLALIAVTSTAFAFVAALGAPGVLFLWGPLLLGVPHLVADVRYLVVRPPGALTYRARDLAVVALLGATIWSASPTVGGAAVLAALALAPMPAVSDHRAWVRRAVVMAIAGGLYALAWRAPVTASYLLLHGHNVVAIGLFVVVIGRGRARWLVLGAAGLGSAVILLGVVDPLLPRAALDDFVGYVLPLDALERWSAVSCARIALLFVFLQSVHYAIWLRLIPEQARPRAGMRGFAASLRALQTDFTSWIVLAIVVGAAALIAYGVHDAAAARNAYLRVASFHAYLELAFVARWLVRLPRRGAV